MTFKNNPTKRKKLFIIIAICLGTLMTIRLILPSIVLHFANKNLATMKGYYGHIHDIDLFIIRGAYRIDSVYLNKIDLHTNKQTPFFSASHVDLSVEWGALFHGSLVGEVTFKSPVLLFTKDKVEPAALLKDSTYFKKLLRRSMPLKINRFEALKGIIRYIDEGTNPPVDIEVTNTYIVAQNLRNSYDSSTLLPAKIIATASFYEGILNVNMNLNLLANAPTFASGSLA